MTTIPDFSGDAHRQSLRTTLGRLEADGELVVVKDEVDPVHELGAYLLEAGSGPALLFERVLGHEMAAVGNLLNSRGRIATSLGLRLGELHDRLAAAPDRVLSPVVVEGAPCQEIVLDEADLRGLPVPEFFTGETGRYITAGVIVAKGAAGRNASFARLKVLDKSHAFIGIAPEHHLAVLAREQARKGEGLEVAVTIGNHPAVLLAGAYYLGLGDDELEVAGALMGEGLEVVGCKSVDLFVPAHCEIVIEGAIDATSMLEEGPVSEYSGLYESYGKGPVVTVRHMTMRRDALFQTILPGYGREHIVIGAVAIAAVLERHLGRVFPNLAECTITDGGCGRLHAVVALREAEQGQAEAVIVEGLSALRLVKRLVVVDDDIDVHDPVQVEWAMATRMKADRDLFVFPAMASSRSDPLAVGATVSKLGIDATRRHGDRSDWNRAVPPEAMRLKARLALSRHAGIAANLGAAQDQGVDGRSMSSPST